MNFTELVDEVQARVSEDISDTRAGRMVNWACAELDGMHLWPYREKSTTGTAPLTISDLGVVEAVTNESNDYPLRPTDFRSLLETYGDLTRTGYAELYYVAWPAGVPVVATYPVTTDTIGVQYYKVTAEISGATSPAAPSRFHGLIVDMAVQRAYRDSDEHEAARELQAEIDRQIARMMDELLGGQTVQGPGVYQHITGESVDW